MKKEEKIEKLTKPSSNDKGKMRASMAKHTPSEEDGKERKNEYLEWKKLSREQPQRTKFLKILPATPNMLGLPWVDITSHYGLGGKDPSKAKGNFICTGHAGNKEETLIPELYKNAMTKDLIAEYASKFGLVLTDEQNAQRKERRKIFEAKGCKGCEMVQEAWLKWRKTLKESAKKDIVHNVINRIRANYRPVCNVYDIKDGAVKKFSMFKAALDEISAQFDQFQDFADIDSPVVLKVIKKLRDPKREESFMNIEYVARLVRDDQYLIDEEKRKKILGKRYDLLDELRILDVEEQLKVINYAGGEELDENTPPDCFGDGSDAKDEGCFKCVWRKKCDDKVGGKSSDEDEDDEPIAKKSKHEDDDDEDTSSDSDEDTKGDSEDSDDDDDTPPKSKSSKKDDEDEDDSDSDSDDDDDSDGKDSSEDEDDEDAIKSRFKRK